MLLSAATKAALPDRAPVQLHIHAHFVTDEPLRLYGFSTTAETGLFQTLLGVQGVGPRVALAILAGMETARAGAGDRDERRRAPEAGEGGGRKIAERLPWSCARRS